MDRRERLIAVFEDTQAYYTENRRLADAVQRSKAAVRLYAENDYPELPDAAKAGSVAVTKSKPSRRLCDCTRHIRTRRSPF